MTECVAVSNQKGGVGKTTTVNAVGAGLFRRGYRVLYVDLDPQGNLSYSLGIGQLKSGQATVVDVLTGGASLEEAIVHTTQGDLLPFSPSLSKIDTLLPEVGKEYSLKTALHQLEAGRDNISGGTVCESSASSPESAQTPLAQRIFEPRIILVDTPPALGTLTVNALTACNSLIIPAQADVFSLQGAGQLIQTIQAVKKYCNKDLMIRGFLLVRYSSRAVISRDMTELLENTAQQLNTKVYNTKIRECVALKEAQAKHQDIFTYNVKSNAAEDYDNLIKEILGEE